MDNSSLPAATYAAANIAAVDANDCSLSVNHSPPLLVLRDRPIDEIIDGVYPTQVRYEHQHSPQFYLNTASPRIVTQPDVNNSKAAALLTMLQDTAHSCPPSLPLLHFHYGNKPSTLPNDGFNVTGNLIDSFPNNWSGDSSYNVLDDVSASVAVTPFNKICCQRKRIITSIISQFFMTNTPRDW